jgi:hypothetical protein
LNGRNHGENLRWKRKRENGKKDLITFGSFVKEENSANKTLRDLKM